MIRIALVGGIGSGKTYISKLFNHPLFNADIEVKKIYKNNRNCFKKLNHKFPNNIKSFPIKKSEIKAIINEKNINILSKIVHPYVRVALKKFLIKNRKKNFVILDIPLLIENKLYKKSDILIYVKTSKKKIFNRLKRRKNYNKKIVSILRSQQKTDKAKIKLCDFVINNNLDKKNAIKQIREIYKKI